MNSGKSSYTLGGWSQKLHLPPYPHFQTTMYGMVTDLVNLRTRDWDLREAQVPRYADYKGSVLWTYGGVLCSPEKKPATDEEIDNIINITLQNGWDGVDFDDECDMDIDRIITCMQKLKNAGKETSYTFLAGLTYNNPELKMGKNVNDKIKKIIDSKSCDRLVHLCYATSMWTEDDIKNHVRQALNRTLSYGIDPRQIILACTSEGLNDWNLDYFLTQVTELELGGLFIWRYNKLDIHSKYFKMIADRLNLAAVLESEGEGAPKQAFDMPYDLENQIQV